MADLQSLPRKLWAHPNPQSTNAWIFIQAVNRNFKLNLNSWDDLHRWSVNSLSDFYDQLFKQFPLIHSGHYERVLDTSARLDSVPKWFQGVKLNYAENALYSADPTTPSNAVTRGKEDNNIACIEVREGCKEIRNCSWRELRERVGHLSNAMRAHGVRKGDRVAVVASNSIDTLIVFFAITTLGGLFSSSSTDMGTKGVLDRLQQTRPKYVFVDDWSVYNGKTLDLRPKMEEIVTGMANVADFEGLVSMPRWQDRPANVTKVPRTQQLAQFLQRANGNTSLRFERVEFADPFLIVYSSGTTGMPKCIVHSTGGVLVVGQKESKLSRDTGPNATVLQYTTTGWIMYLKSCSSLVDGARVVLYDGSPFQPDLTTFLRLLGDLKVTDFGTSPRYLQTLATANSPICPRDVTDLRHLRRVVSTGMVLSEAQFDWFYDHGFPAHTQLSNIAGGTDLAACLVMDCPLKPLYAGGCMTPALGMRIEAYDQDIGHGQKGRAVPLGEAGELVCSTPFPSMPVKFWGDDSGKKYFDAYFARFDNVWTHGDFISFHPRTGGVYLLGRADGVLNPSGVRFGSAEIYNVIDHHFPDEVQDSICVGQRRPQDHDESVMLFLLMKPGRKFTPDLVRRVKEAIAHDAGRRCVPKYVFETPEIPTTINLKKVELPVKQIVSGKIIKPSDTLANKECLKFYYQFAKVEEIVQEKSKL